MDHILSKLILYGSMPGDSILMQLGDICRCARSDEQDADVLTTRCYEQVKRILIVSTDYAFDENL